MYRPISSRRAFLAGLGGLVAVPALGWAGQPAASRLDAIAARIEPVLALSNAHTGERLTLRYFTGGAYDQVALARLNWLMRDWRAREVAQIDVRLFWALSAIAQAAMQEGHSGLIALTSGYRTARTNRALEGAVPNSMHLKARAVDFMLAGLPTTALFHYARWLGLGGVGHYPGRFVHVDTGRVRSWTG